MKRETLLMLFLGLTLLIGAVVASYFDLDTKFIWLIQNTALKSSELPKSSADPNIGKPSIPAITASLSDTKQYHANHGLGADPVMADGLALAISGYARHYGLKPDIGIYVRTSSAPMHDDIHAIKIVVGIEKEEKTYTSEYSTRAQDAQSNLNHLVAVLGQFSRDFPRDVPPIDDLRKKLSGKAVVLPPLQLTTLSGSWIAELEKLTKSAQKDPLTVSALRRAEEIFSWMSIFKSWHNDQTLSLQFASEAIGYELIARALEPSPAVSQVPEGLMWLAAHYERYALTVLEATGHAPGSLADLLLGYIRLDTDRLERLARHSKGEQAAVAGYLLGRVYGYLQQTRTASSALDRVLVSSPNFTEALFYRVDIAELGDQRASLRHAMQLMMNEHRVLTGKPSAHKAESSWHEELFTGDLDLLNRSIETLVTEHMTLTSSLPVSTFRDGLVRGDLVRLYVREDFLNSCLVAYRMYDVTLSIFEHAQAVAASVRKAYPLSAMSRMIEFRTLQDRGELHEALRQAQSINIQSAGPLLLREVLRIYGAWDDFRTWHQVVGALEAYRNTESAGSEGSRLLGFYTYYSLHREYGIEMVKRAIELNPYDIYAYRDLSEYQRSAEPLTLGSPYVGHLYPYMMLVANWHAKHDQPEIAVRHYEKAIARAPDTYMPYSELAQLYRKQNKPELTVKVLNRYLAHDTRTLSAIDAQNTIGYIALEKKNNQEALNIFSKTRRSMQNGALGGYAQVNERLGRINKAREVYTEAANRYPQHYVPARLAMFELRQGNQKEAIQILQRYAENNRSSYYFEELITHYKQLSRPEDAEKIVRAVEGPDIKPIVLYELAAFFTRMKLPQQAAKLHRELAQSGDDRFLHAALYYENARLAYPQKADELLNESKSFLGDDARQLGRFTLQLARLNRYKEAFEVLGPQVPTYPEMAQHKVLMQGLYWRLAGLDKEQFAKIDQTALKDDSWRQQLLNYLVDGTDPASLFAAVKDTRQFLMAHFYVAVVHLHNNNTREAIAHLRTGLAMGPANQDEQYLAYNLLARLDEKNSGWCCRINSY